MSETKKCAKCGKWFVPIPERQNASCCVMHGPNDCCHFAEREVPPPTPDRAADVNWPAVNAAKRKAYEAMRAYDALVASLADPDSGRGGSPMESADEALEDALNGIALAAVSRPAAVREALASLLSVAPPMLVARLEDALGVRSSLTTQWQGEEAVKALVGAVSRPAADGEVDSVSLNEITPAEAHNLLFHNRRK